MKALDNRFYVKFMQLEIGLLKRFKYLRLAYFMSPINQSV